MKTMSRGTALSIVSVFAFNFAIKTARAMVMDAIEAASAEQLDSWYQMQRVFEKVRDELRAKDSFYYWSLPDLDQDEFIVAKWMLGQNLVEQMIREHLKSFTPATLESLGADRVEKRKEELRKAAEDWVVDNRG